MAHVLDLQEMELLPEDGYEGADSTLSEVFCPPCPSIPSLIVCC